MKTKLIIAATAILAIIAGTSIFYLWQNYRGIGPAIKPPAENIADIINEVPQTGENSTGFPLKMPAGFNISVYAEKLPGARVMAYDNTGRILVSSPSTGKIFAVAPGEKSTTVTTVLSGLNKPHGMAVRCLPETDGCEFYVAEENKLSRYTLDLEGSAIDRQVLADLPSGGRHFTRTLMFMPYPDDSKLLISIGSSCDVCNEENPMRGSIQVYDVAIGKMEEFAKGLRNSVFMSIHPVNGKIWATEMGRDLLGDNLPPDEINIVEKGKNYGWPICYGKNIHDDAFDKNTYIRNPCMEPFETPSHIDLQAHSAPLGLAFFPEEGWPQEYWHNLLVAYHGSWNRTEPTGYKLVRIKLDQNGNYLGQEDFISGWLQGNSALGRPVDILIQPGGTIFVSDDKAGLIYKILYRQPEKPADKSNLIRVSEPQPNQTISSPLTIKGEARGNWYFEASFPIKLVDANGKTLIQTYAQAQGEWMTTDFVPFEVTLNFDKPTTATGTLILEKDNPSGLPEFDDKLEIPVNFSAQPIADGCKATGCSGEICSDQEVASICIYKEEFACYKTATCARQANGQCGWTQTSTLTACIDQARNK